MKRIVALTIALSLAALSSALAHGTESRILGTVTAVTPTTITVRAEDGDIVPVTLNDATTYRSGADSATLATVVVGARIAITVGTEPGSTTARLVRVGVAGSATPDSKKAGSSSPSTHSQMDHDHAH